MGGNCSNSVGKEKELEVQKVHSKVYTLNRKESRKKKKRGQARKMWKKKEEGKERKMQESEECTVVGLILKTNCKHWPKQFYNGEVL